MGKWNHYCKECPTAISMKWEYCFDHKHLATVEPPKIEVRPNTTGHAGRGCKDD